MSDGEEKEVPRKKKRSKDKKQQQVDKSGVVSVRNLLPVDSQQSQQQRDSAVSLLMSSSDNIGSVGSGGAFSW